MIIRDKLRDQYIFYEKIKKINNYKDISLIYCLFFFYFTIYLQIQTILRRDFVIRASPPHTSAGHNMMLPSPRKKPTCFWVGFRKRAKKIRRRTTLPHSCVQYHRRWGPYRSCSGWEREYQPRHRHRKKKLNRRCQSYVLAKKIIDDLLKQPETSWFNRIYACLLLSSRSISWQKSNLKKGGQASRPVSNTKLKTLLLVHLYPIKLVVFKRSSGE